MVYCQAMDDPLGNRILALIPPPPPEPQWKRLDQPLPKGHWDLPHPELAGVPPSQWPKVHPRRKVAAWKLRQSQLHRQLERNQRKRKSWMRRLWLVWNLRIVRRVAIPPCPSRSDLSILNDLVNLT